MAIRYPTQLDSNTNLYLVHDSLRLRLAEDYNPGDTAITVDPSPVLAKFPPTGIITLTEQCSEIDSRAISFEYSGRNTRTNQITGLVLLEGFPNIAKPKRFTHVAMNVVAPHHNELKNALIAVQKFAGRKGEVAKLPLVGTMEQRINFLRHLVLKPKAWFGADTTVGVVPFTVKFADLSLRAPVKFEWDFGDNTTETLVFPYVPGDAEGTSNTVPNGSISHTYTTPADYDVTLTVTNPFGTNTITLEKFISARTGAPDAATITFNPSPSQVVTSNVIRSRINTPIEIDVLTNGEQALDPIVQYSWRLSDDLQHPSLPTANAQYSIGGIYDVILRTDTQLDAFRITKFPEVIDIVERQNLWLTAFDPNASPTAVTKNAFTYEFGLLSETFKIKTHQPLSISRDAGFLTGLPNVSQQKREFFRNNGFTPRGLTASGDQGVSLLYWSEGASAPTSSQTIRFAEFNGFTDTYASSVSIGRNWNWVSLNAPDTIYFLFGIQYSGTTPIDLTNPTRQELDLSTLTASGHLMNANKFQNGAQELLTNVGDGTDGEFSVYRSCWRDSTGYIARNDGAGSYFRLKSFYRTEGILANPVKMIRKLPDIPGATKFEGQLVPLTGGVYFFNNTGEVSLYNPVTNIWASGGPGISSPAFATLQDKTVTGFDSPSNTLLATSDNDRLAFLSYDYSSKSFVKFNEADLTFTKMPNRPEGEQFQLVCY